MILRYKKPERQQHIYCLSGFIVKNFVYYNDISSPLQVSYRSVANIQSDAH